MEVLKVFLAAGVSTLFDSLQEKQKHLHSSPLQTGSTKSRSSSLTFYKCRNIKVFSFQSWVIILPDVEAPAAILPYTTVTTVTILSDNNTCF